jgi:ankyrin repeat protein
MPESLPRNPHIEHLKKQAKALFRDLRDHKPGAVERFRNLNVKGAPKLADAQHAIAREYGFESWPHLKENIDSLSAQTEEAVRRVRQALRDDNVEEFRRIVARCVWLKNNINDPIADFDSPIVTKARSDGMLDALLEAGADINARSEWWAGGFGLLDSASPELATYAIRRGATVTVHAAARLGLRETLKELIEDDPQLVHARGGDGQTPLHFASTVEIAEYLLDRGADIDARDVDHESTPAQYMVRSRQNTARYLIRRGCKTDILMAAALGDVALAQKLLDENPECIRMRVSSEHFTMVGDGRPGGTIYQWELGWYVSPVQVARRFGHDEIFDFLMDRSPAEEKLLNACWLRDRDMVQFLLEQDPNLAAKLPEAGRRHVAHAARNNDETAVRLMLMAGLPVNQFSQHHASALHWAAFHGNAELIRLMLPYRPAIENADNQYKGTPLGWAIYGSLNGWHSGQGDYAGCVEALLNAGAKPPNEPGGSEAVQAILLGRQ